MNRNYLEDIVYIIRTDRMLTSLKIGLIHTLGRVTHVKQIAEALKTNMTITSVDMHSNKIGEEGAKAIAEALKSNKTITRIDLSNNEIGDEGVNELAEVLKTNKTITSINLAGNGIGTECAKEIAKVLKANQTITRINLSNNEIGDEGIKELAQALKSNKTLISIKLHRINISIKGAKEIAKVLKTNQTITRIDLSYSKIGDEVAKEIAKVLKINQTITRIDLSDNEIGDEGVKKIAEVLKTNQTITSLNLNLNRIGNEGAKEIAKVLKTNQTITRIDLSDNEIGDEGAKEIANALKTNQTISWVDLITNIDINVELRNEIKTLIERNIKAQHDRKISYEKARNMAVQKEDPQAVLLALETALTFAEQIKDKTSIEEFKQHVSLYEILASLQELGIHGMHQWKTIIEGALQPDATMLYSDPLPKDSSYDTHLQAAIRQHREKADPSLNNRAKLIKLDNAFMALSQLEDPRAEEAFHDLKQDFQTICNILRYKHISEILAPLKQLGIFGLARQWEILVDKKLNADTFRLFEANLPDDPSINSVAIAGIRQVRTATQTTKDHGSLTTLYNSYRKLSESVDHYAKRAMNQLERDLDTADKILRLKFSNK